MKVGEETSSCTRTPCPIRAPGCSSRSGWAFKIHAILFFDLEIIHAEGQVHVFLGPRDFKNNGENSQGMGPKDP